MKPVITPEESARLDQTANDPVETLMERAGLAVALAAVAMGASYGSRVVVLAGPGNNGGDGYVAAQYLMQRGVAVVVHALAPPKSPAAARAHRSAVEAGVRVRDLEDPVGADLVIDALFGAGFRGDLPGAVAAWTATEAPVLAVDIPSGLDAATGEAPGPAFSADCTVTFHARKVGHLVGRGPDLCGRIQVADIGLEGGHGEFLLCEEDDAPRPVRARHAHKWSSGSVVVVGGSAGLTGAAHLAARSALRGGAGAVTIACPAALQPIYAGMAAEIMTVGIGSGASFAPGDVLAVLQSASRYDVMALGPGLGTGQEGFVAGLMESWEGPLIIDADGINAIDSAAALAKRSFPTLITPHAGEFRRLADVEATFRSARELASTTGAVVLLKGSPTFVAGEQLWAVISGGVELATIGTGDVLTGLVAALWARGLDPETAARSAAYWHGRAGAAAVAGGTLTADILATEIRRFAW
ncbi:MAG: NAD(P)H-hydrate dehydratase [Acidimicrobiia bacterium]|nr:NAD(P)H-hydrate dehydratase [Acidimicrobiia bacterium]MDH5615283.1 NAD(P)H-hydrate dehydratase [Acidimicrobiia bacterium]